MKMMRMSHLDDCREIMGTNFQAERVQSGEKEPRTVWKEENDVNE